MEGDFSPRRKFSLFSVGDFATYAPKRTSLLTRRRRRCRRRLLFRRRYRCHVIRLNRSYCCSFFEGEGGGKNYTTGTKSWV